MAFRHGKSAAVLMSQFNLSAYFRGADIGRTVDVHETTCYGATAKAYIPGIKDGTLSLEGLWDGAADAVDEDIQEMLGTASGQVVSFAPRGIGFNNDVILLSSRLTSYTVSAPVGDLVTVNVDLQADGGIDRGVQLHGTDAITTATDGTSINNSASSSGGYAANLHVVAFSGTDATIKVQHSTNDSVWADLVTFTQATGLTSERKTGTGTVNQYVRYSLTGTFSSITFAVGFARR